MNSFILKPIILVFSPNKDGYKTLHNIAKNNCNFQQIINERLDSGYSIIKENANDIIEKKKLKMYNHVYFQILSDNTYQYNLDIYKTCDFTYQHSYLFLNLDLLGDYFIGKEYCVDFPIDEEYKTSVDNDIFSSHIINKRIFSNILNFVIEIPSSKNSKNLNLSKNDNDNKEKGKQKDKDLDGTRKYSENDKIVCLKSEKIEIEHFVNTSKIDIIKDIILVSFNANIKFYKNTHKEDLFIFHNQIKDNKTFISFKWNSLSSYVINNILKHSNDSFSEFDCKIIKIPNFSNIFLPFSNYYKKEYRFHSQIIKSKLLAEALLTQFFKIQIDENKVMFLNNSKNIGVIFENDILNSRPNNGICVIIMLNQEVKIDDNIYKIYDQDKYIDSIGSVENRLNFDSFLNWIYIISDIIDCLSISYELIENIKCKM